MARTCHKQFPLLVLLFFLAAAPALFAQSSRAGHSGAVSLSALGEYDCNATYGSQANFDLLADVPVGERFDCQPAVQFASAGIYSAALQARTLFPVGKGCIYLKDRFLFRDIARSNMYDACLGASVGYYRPHLEAELGMFGRFMDALDRNWHSLDGIMCEPFNCMYTLKGLLRPAGSGWNVSLALTNVDLFQMERMWQPIFILGGNWDCSERLEILADIVCKPTGMFHLNAETYSLTARAGITYRF